MHVVQVLACSALLSCVLHAQTSSTTAPASNPAHTTDQPQTDATTPATKGDIDTLTAALAKQDKAQDFELSLGIGSLIDASASDYTNQSNTLTSNNLGRASPQYLIGVSFRTPFPNFRKAKASPKSASTSAAPSPAPPAHDPTPAPCPAADKITDTTEARCQFWHQHPWKGFVSLKFASGSSQVINGYVLGGSYQIAHWMDLLVGFGFTPFNEASPGLKVTASQYVTAQQKLGNLLNFDPVAMLNGQRNAFDGFSLTDTSGKLIYKGTPLEVHYRGGVVIGVAIPISFKNSFSAK